MGEASATTPAWRQLGRRRRMRVGPRAIPNVTTVRSTRKMRMVKNGQVSLDRIEQRIASEKRQEGSFFPRSHEPKQMPRAGRQRTARGKMVKTRNRPAF